MSDRSSNESPVKLDLSDVDPRVGQLVGGGKTGVRGMTVRLLQVEPTARCNFTCGFCAGRHFDQNDLPSATFEALLDQLSDVEHLELQGGGEPLADKRFKRRIEVR